MLMNWCGTLRNTSDDDDGSNDIRDSRAGASGNPFHAYDDGYEWPNLYQEINEMLELCALASPISLLRHLVKKRKLKDLSKIVLNAPMTALQVSEAVLKMRPDLDAALGERDLQTVEVFAQMLDVMEDRGMITETAGCSMIREECIQPTTFVAFGDEIGQTDVAYAVNVDSFQQRITVFFRGFRGSIFNGEKGLALGVYMKEERNPMKRHSSQHHSISIHNAVHESMYSPSRNTTGKVVSGYQKIMQEVVLPVLQKNEGFKLYVTGYSSGASLATMFAVEAAAEPDAIVPKPVTCVSLASPYVGDESFRSAHQLLEGLGKLRHLRVSNHKDIATTLPEMSFRWKLFDRESHVGRRFKHVGMNLRLFQKGETHAFEMSYPKVRNGILFGAVDEVLRGWDNSVLANISWNPIEYLKYDHHSLREYNKRLQDHREVLETMKLNIFYAKTDVVGKLTSCY